MQINPEVKDTYELIHAVAVEEGKPEPDVIIDFGEAARVCGIGEKGLSGKVLNEKYGPFMRFCFIITDAPLVCDKPLEKHICDNCKECIKSCPGKAISEEGKVEPWQCAVYYNGANGLKNPFMPKDAYTDFEDRLQIIAGEAMVTPEKARKILDATFFYPPAQHAYTASICGRACDTARYSHLEKQVKLTKKFKRPFREREEWKFKIEDYK